jgi:hypothetical protein
MDDYVPAAIGPLNSATAGHTLQVATALFAFFEKPKAERAKG